MPYKIPKDIYYDIIEDAQLEPEYKVQIEIIIPLFYSMGLESVLERLLINPNTNQFEPERILKLTDEECLWLREIGSNMNVLRHNIFALNPIQHRKNREI